MVGSSSALVERVRVRAGAWMRKEATSRPSAVRAWESSVGRVGVHVAPCQIR
jgi:hypothetical protein